MKSIKFLLILILAVCLFQDLNAQTTAVSPISSGKLSGYTGSSSPLGEFNDFAKTGVDFGIAYDFGITKYWGMGFDFNRQMNTSQIPIERYNFPESGSNYQVSSSFSSRWVANTFGFGPWWLIQPGGPSGNPGGYSFELYSKAGVSFIKSPETKTVFTYSGRDLDLYNLPQQNKVGFGLTSGIRFKKRINENLSFFLNPQYVYSSTKFDYRYRELYWAYGSTGGAFIPSAVIEDKMVTEQVSPNYFNVNFGLTYNIGKRKERKEEKEVKGQAILLTYPENNAVYIEDKPYKSFKWNHIGKERGGIYQYKIIVTSISKKPKVYTGYSSTTEISFKEVFGSDAVKGKYSWKVVEMNSNMTASPFILKSTSSGLDVLLQNITCKDPAFDADGNVCYTAEVVLTNSANNNASLIVDAVLTMNDADGANAASTANIISCSGSSSPVSFDLTLAPGSTETACIEFCRPIGETDVYLEADYRRVDLPNVAMNEIALDTLPNCMCNTCDDWEINEENNEIDAVSSSTSNYSLESFININGSGNIIKATATIISLETNGAAGCDSCFMSSATSGMFSGESGSGVISNGASAWQSSGQGDLSDDNADGYGNSFEWNASSTSGVDFSTSQSMLMNLNLPSIQYLDCCGRHYKICVKYTFTNVDCQTCEFIKCYTITNK